VLPDRSGAPRKTTPQAGVGSFCRGVPSPQPLSTDIERACTDIVQHDATGLRFAIDCFGIDCII